jgi:hypothetical protein
MSAEFWIDGNNWGWPIFIYLCGLLAAIDAIWNGRTSQGTLAWVTTLTFIPFIAFPLYLFFGSRKFHESKYKASNKPYAPALTSAVTNPPSSSP